MKLTIKTETEILRVYDSWLYAYLNGDVATYDQHLDDNYHFIGSTNNEEFLDRKATINFFEATADQLAGKCLLKNENKILEKFGELIFITHVFDAWFLNGSEWTYYSRFRFSSVLQEKKHGWRFIYQHFSTTDNKADAGETIGFDKVHLENQELREAIKRRTVELEAKNRELEVEGTLERVRAEATAMKKSSDLFDVVVLMRKEFLSLGHQADYFWHMSWEKESYNMSMTSHDGSRVGMVITVPKFVHDTITPLANWEKSKDSTFVLALNAKEAWDYIEKMNTHGHYQQADPNAPTQKDIEEIGGLTFIIARTSHGEIGYSLPGVVHNPPIEDLHILERFAGVFDLAHSRYLDLQKAEKQAREVQIELALEKVRSRTMAMQHSDELQEASFLLDQQVRALGISTRGCAFNIYGENDATEWFSSEQGTMPIYRTPRENVFLEYYEAGRSGESLYIKEFEGDACAAHYDYLCTLPVMGEALKELKANGGSFPEKQIDHATFFKYGYLLFITLDFVPDAHDIFKRFAKVFEQTYTRFLDLQKAEAQAKEAQIETALERVRSRTMAMQNSEELEEVILEVLKKLQGLGISMEQRAAAIFTYEAGNKDYTQWVASPEYSSILSFNTPYFDHPVQNDIWNARQNGTAFYAKPYPVEVKNSLFKYLFNLSSLKNMPKAEKTKALQFKHYAISIAFQKHAALVVVDHSGIPLTEAENSILIRLSKVFNQTYTRFLDLQKAEAQAKEAQIEGALEKVRSRSLAMQKSEELLDVIGIVSEQVHALGLKFDTICFGESNKEGAVKFWLTSKGLPKPVLIDVPPIKNKAVHRVVKAQKDGLKFLADVVTGNTYTKWNNHMLTHSQLQYLPEAAKTYLTKTSGFARSSFFLKEIALYVMNYKIEPFSDADNAIFNRFAQVFDQSYTRFLDLKKAEAQAREAQIEAALEKVRSRSMAMQNSEELLEVITVVSQQLQTLGFRFTNTLFINNSLKKDYSFWVASTGLPNPMRFIIPYAEMPIMRNLRNAQKNKVAFYTDVMSLKEHQEWFGHLLKHSGKNAWPKEISDYQMSKGLARSVSIHTNIMLAVTNSQSLPYSDYENKIIERFGQVFEQSYTRFLDLQTAEKNTYKNKVEAALERVRSRAMAMQEPEELKDVAHILRIEMGLLGIEELETCSIYILDKKVAKAECWYAIKDSTKNKKLVADHISMDFNATWVGKQMLEFHDSKAETSSVVMKGDKRKEWITYCMSQSKVLKDVYSDTIPDRTYHLQKFSHGAIGAASAGDISAESWALLKRSASVFSLAYARFKDLTQARIDLKQLKKAKKRAEEALSELQQTQTQLIQSEKMASLGELTAGIAHEIQNPLNFVNNFSEVSKELLEEMQEEIENGDFEEVKAIMEDVIQNLEKINHHGKRADGIVKGMLQHSRSSTGTKEPTDINALADEYLRLAYHGLRAKDKSFNAELVTNFDLTIGKINVMPQDMGRVILNLITNAFYAANERKQTSKNEAFKPTVSLSTKKLKDTIEISVKDNGNGIPKEITDKIFQPFFTTKPTGQGTGLGLSMSYDIVTKGHGGELKVETEENEGTTFSVVLPIAGNSN